MSERIYIKDGLSIIEDFAPPKIPDHTIFNWFRGEINHPYATARDLMLSQDCRYIAPILYFLARTLHARTIVEIGVADGTTTMPLVKAASEVEGGWVYSVDPSTSNLDAIFNLADRNNLRANWAFYNMTSDEFFPIPGNT